MKTTQTRSVTSFRFTSLAVIFAVLAVVITSMVKYYPDFVCTMLPPYWDAYFVRAMYDRNLQNHIRGDDVKIPMLTKVVPLPIKKENIGQIMHKDGMPSLVKNVVNTDQDHLMGILARSNKGKKLRMLSFANYSIPHFSPSCGIVEFATKHLVDFDYFAENHLFTNVSHIHSDLYAGFEAVTDPATIEEMTSLDLRELGDYRQNNLFTSNFKEETMSATLHCAPIDSLTFQFVGTKTWYLVSPEQLTELYGVHMPTAFNLPLTDDQLLSKLKEVRIVKQEPGDAFYFGPHWCHAVSTAQGPNLMMNIRYNALDKIKKGPKSLALKIMLRALLRPRAFSGGKPQDNVSIYPMLYDDLTKYYDNCGASETLDKMMEIVKSM